MTVSFGLDTRFGKGVWAEILLNGALISEIEPGAITAQSLAIHQEVFPGANVLEVHVGATGAGPRHAAQVYPQLEAEDYAVSLSLESDSVQDKGDEYEITTRVLDEVEWEPDLPATLPHVIRMNFEASAGQAPPIWGQALPIDVADATGPIAEALGRLNGYLAAGEVDRFEAEMSLRNQDMARAFPLTGTATELARRDAASVARELSAPNFAMQTPARADLRLRAFAGGRLFDCRGPDGEPFLRGRAGGGDPVHFATTFAWVGGRVAVVR